MPKRPRKKPPEQKYFVAKKDGDDEEDVDSVVPDAMQDPAFEQRVENAFHAGFLESSTDEEPAWPKYGTDAYPPLPDVFDTEAMIAMPPRFCSRASYSHVAAGLTDEQVDASSFPLEWGEITNYRIAMSKIVGTGAYGEVVLGRQKITGKKTAMKIIKPEKEKRIKIQKEVMMLSLVKGGTNIIELLDIVKDPKSHLKMLVFEAINSVSSKTMFNRMTDLECRNYLYQVLRALHFTHFRGIMHRDVKTGNILYDADRKVVKLIDWGFGEFYRPDKLLPHFPGTKSWKAPELFLRYDRYDYAVDMWAFGCLVGIGMFNRRVFEKAQDSNLGMVQGIVQVLGTDDFDAYREKYGMPSKNRSLDLAGLDPESPKTRSKFQTRINARNERRCSPEGIDLLNRLLVYDHEARLTAEEALEHPFFDPLRKTTDPNVIASDTSSFCAGSEARTPLRRAKGKDNGSSTGSYTYSDTPNEEEAKEIKQVKAPANTTKNSKKKAKVDESPSRDAQNGGNDDKPLKTTYGMLGGGVEPSSGAFAAVVVTPVPRSSSWSSER